MALDPSIALGVRPIELPNQLAQYGQLAAIQNAQNQNALAQYQLSSAQRTDEQQNSLYAAAKQPGFNLDYQTAVQYGPAGIAAYKAKQEADNALTEGQIKRTKLLTDKLALLPEAYKTADTPEAYLKLHETVHSDPVLGPWLKSTGATPEKGRAAIQAAVESGKFNDLRLASMQSVAQLLESVKPQVVAASSSVFDPKTRSFTQAPAAQERTDTDLIRNYNAAVKQGFVGSIFDYERKIKEAGKPPPAPRPEAAPRTQQVTMRDGTLGIMNMDTGAITPALLNGAPVQGKPSAFAEKTAIQQKQLGVDIGRTIGELENAAKPGGLIDQSTGSGIGRAIDATANFVGQATPGAIAIAKLAPIADMVLKMVPRFEGPQSDKDTTSYKQAAGQLADASLPVEIRQAAATEIVRLMKARKAQFSSTAIEAGGGSPPPAAGAAREVDFGSLK